MYLTSEITNPNVLNSMFGGKLELDQLIMDAVLLYSGPNMKLSFTSNKMPEVIPTKWKIKKYNHFSFCLDFSNLEEINIKHWEPLMLCSPVIKSVGEKFELKIHKDNICVISCISCFLTLSDVNGGLDLGAL